MSLPELTVEFGFGQSIGTAYGSVTWTDVTSYVRAGGGLSVSRGRAVVGQAPTAGTLSVALANDDGRFTPGRTGGPYGSGVKARIPVRVRATVSATVYDVWYGFVTDWAWTPGGEVLATVQAADILAQAAKITCRPWLTGRHLSKAPSFYWPLTDAVGATSAAAAAGVPARAYQSGGSGAVAFGIESDVSPEGAGETVAAFSPGAAPWQQYTRLGTQIGATPAAPLRSFIMSAYFRPLDRYGYDDVIVALDSGLGLPGFRVAYSDRLIMVTEPYHGLPAASNLRSYGTDTITENAWHHVLVAYDATEAVWSDRVRVWVDGVAMPGSTSAPDDPSDFAADVTLSIGGILQPDVEYGGFYGQLAHVAFWPTFSASVVGLPVADPEALAVFLADGGDGSPAAADRFAELDDVTPVPGAIASWLAADATALQSVSPQPTAARTLLEVAQDVATTERGTLIAGRDGRLRLQSSRARLTETVTLTLDARTDVLTFDGAFGVDDADAVDEVTVTQKPSGATYTGRRTGGDSLESSGFDVWTPSAVHAQSVADGAANYPVDVPKAPNLTVSMGRAGVAGLAGGVLALELGDLIRVTNLPASAPDTTVDLVVEAISHAVDAGGWTVTFDTSPGPLAAGAVVGTTGTLSTVATTLTVRS